MKIVLKKKIIKLNKDALEPATKSSPITSKKEELKRKLAELERQINDVPIPKPMPPKPAKKRTKKPVYKGAIPWGHWSNILKNNDIYKNHKIEQAPEAGRLDVYEDHWRISVVSMINEEFCANLYLIDSYVMLKVEHINVNMLIHSIELLYNQKTNYMKGDNNVTS